MREHALPQDVTGYRFHIIGNMTLKQFAEVAVGVVAGFLIYQTNLPVIIKWPAIFIAAGIGAFAAFVPFEERPFDHWIVAFFQALYRPTQFYWKRSSKIPDAFLYQAKSTTRIVADVDLSPLRRQRAQDFLHSVAEAPPLSDALDQFEEQQVGTIMEFFTTTQTVPTPTIEEIEITPPSHNPPTNPDIISTPSSAQPPNIIVPPTTAISVEAVVQDTPMAQESNHTTTPPTQQEYVENISTPTTHLTPPTQIVQNQNLPFPEMPNEPNKVVGMVLDQNNTPLSNIIVEILTSDGFSARAVKTNLLGQFFITTPLNNGTYSVVAEKDGLRFTPQQLVVDGNIIHPIEVRAVASL